MDTSKKYNLPSPEESANPISKVFFCWVLPLFKYGYSHELEIKDLYNTPKQDASGTLGDRLQRNWEKEMERAKNHNKKPSLIKAIKATFIKKYLFYSFLTLFYASVLKILQPITLAAFIQYFSKNHNDVAQGWILGAVVVLLAFMTVVIMHHLMLGTSRIGMQIRIACGSLIYRKLLKLNRSSAGKVELGQLVNLLSNDVQRFDIAAMYFNYIWLMPIQAVVCFITMYMAIGWAAAPGFIAILIQAVPIQGYLSKLQGKYRYEIAKRTDKRVKLMNEITTAIQVIKMYAWEKPFIKMVELSRKYEINSIAKASYIKGISSAMMVFTERTIVYLSVVAYVLMGNILTGDIVFSMSQLFNTVQLFISIFYPMAMAAYAEAKISVQRIEEFLLKDEINLNCDNLERNNEKNGLIKLTKVSASWLPNPIVPTLIDLNLDIKPGKLVCIVGQVGAGKSSLLQILINELPLIQGKLIINGIVSFASQEPWLFLSTIRNNILFGQNYLKYKYKKIINVCSLERDLELFPYGDKTLVGERGASLSGGQRARVNLARCVYRDADIYLFDDPLSAVDPHVAKHIFDECFIKYLNGKTRILVTHQIQFLKQADIIVILNNGKIEKVGSYEEISENDLQQLHLEKPEVNEVEEKNEIVQRERLKSIASIESSKYDDEEAFEAQETEELMEKGSIPSSVYKEYYRAGGNWFLLIFCLFSFIIAQACCNAGDLWLTFWTNKEELRYNQTLKSNGNFSVESSDGNDTIFTTIPSITTTDFMDFSTEYYPEEPLVNSQNFYINIYTVLIIFSIILMSFRSILFYKIAMTTSRNLHNTMFTNVLEATMRFFDTNPSGRILNRFSKDIGIVDEVLPKATMSAIQVFLVMSGILIMVFIVTTWMIGVAIVLGILFYWFRMVYLKSAQNIKRLEGITKAPVLSHVSSSLYGLPTIRSSKLQQLIIREFDTLQDQHTKSWIMVLFTSETFGFYLDVISVVFLAIVTFQFLIFDDGNIRGGSVGLVISQSLILTGMLQLGVRETTEVVNNMTSVERILQYTKLDKEGPFETLPINKPSKNWPDKGQIIFKNVYLYYVAGSLPVLKNLNIEIKSAEKIGIVGRTGAGKSTLISSLFRLAPIDGLIEIDGINTKNIGLIDLRSNISIIPQQPILFSASVRYNLDPFDKSNDKTLWDALENVELKNVIDNLDQIVMEGGSNFSAGQRQLMCLARAIVRNNKILVMDEATANVDQHTDNLIQTTIRRKFKDCTVLTIAHRLNTIMDSDKVLVMEAGEAVEFAPPYELLQNSNGYFTKMVKETGPDMEERLRGIAKDAYTNRNN